MTITETQLLAWVGAWIWPLIRVGGFVMAAPVIGTRAVPARVKMVLVIGLTVVMVPIAAAAAPVAVDPLAAEGLLTGFNQLVIGAVIGLVLRFSFFVFEFAGQLISQQSGLGFASLVDPQSGAQVPVLAHFYILLVTLFFFALDAHLVLIGLLADSFRILPVGPAGLPMASADVVIGWSGELLVTGLLLAMPVVIALLAINFALGVMARAAPQLNIFAVGFPVMIVFGIGLGMMTLDVYLGTTLDFFDQAFAVGRAVLEAR